MYDLTWFLLIYENINLLFSNNMSMIHITLN